MLNDLAEQGYAILPSVFDELVVADLARAIAGSHRNMSDSRVPSRFEGLQTRRLYNLLAQDRRYWSVPTNPQILGAVELVLGDQAQLSAYTSVAIQPGEVAQPLHTDDDCFPVERPHRALGCVVIVTITDFTEANGATRVVPGSHRLERSPDWRTEWVTEHADLQPITMKKGSALMFDASLWHAAGPNYTRTERIGLGICYGLSWLRPHENFYLSLPGSIMTNLPDGLQRLIGLDIINGSLNHVKGMHPMASL